MIKEALDNVLFYFSLLSSDSDAIRTKLLGYSNNK